MRAHACTELTLTVQRGQGGWLLSSEALPGWAAHARTPADLAAACARAFTEAEIAAYARWRGTVYDTAEHAPDAWEQAAPPPAPPAERRHPAEPPPCSEAPPVGWAAGQQRPDCHDPAAWTPLPDGRWRAPNGARYRPDAAVVASVAQRRAALGLPVRP